MTEIIHKKGEPLYFSRLDGHSVLCFDTVGKKK